MELDIKIGKPDWDPAPQKTQTNNWEWRKSVIVTFPNCTFKWIPTYKQILDISIALHKVEKINREVVRARFNDKHKGGMTSSDTLKCAVSRGRLD